MQPLPRHLILLLSVAAGPCGKAEGRFPVGWLCLSAKEVKSCGVTRHSCVKPCLAKVFPPTDTAPHGQGGSQCRTASLWVHASGTGGIPRVGTPARAKDIAYPDPLRATYWGRFCPSPPSLDVPKARFLNLCSKCFFLSAGLGRRRRPSSARCEVQDLERCRCVDKPS